MNQFVDVMATFLALYVTGLGFIAFGKAVVPERRAKKAAKRLGRLGE